MRRDAMMLATQPFEWSTGLDDTREVAEAWSDEVGGGADKLYVRVSRARGPRANAM